MILVNEAMTPLRRWEAHSKAVKQAADATNQQHLSRRPAYLPLDSSI
jgi:hypothetical protein